MIKYVAYPFPQKAANVPEQPLAPVIGLTKEELKALAESVVAPNRQQQIAALLELNRDQQLSAKNEAELDKLLAEVDRIALLKARASYTLQLKQENADQLLWVLTSLLNYGNRFLIGPMVIAPTAVLLNISWVSPLRLIILSLKPVVGVQFWKIFVFLARYATDLKRGAYWQLIQLRRSLCHYSIQSIEEWHRHFEWTASGNQLLGLTPTGRATIVALRMNREAII